MDLREFKIGDRFYTGSGSWVCVDIGTRSIIAVKEDPAVSELRSQWHIKTPNSNDIVKYYDSLPVNVFYPDDWGGCDRKNRFSK